MIYYDDIPYLAVTDFVVSRVSERKRVTENGNRKSVSQSTSLREISIRSSSSSSIR